MASRITVSSSSQCEPARDAVVDRRHHGVVESIAVEVHPESVDLGPQETFERVTSSALRSALSHGAEVDDLDAGVFDPLAPCLGGLPRVAPGELDDILIADQGTASLEVGDDARPSPGDQCQIHGRGLPVRLGLGLIEVGVTVDEQQPEAASPP